MSTQIEIKIETDEMMLRFVMMPRSHGQYYQIINRLIHNRLPEMVVIIEQYSTEIDGL